VLFGKHNEDWNASYEAHLVKTDPQLGLSDPVALANLQPILFSSEKYGKSLEMG